MRQITAFIWKVRAQHSKETHRVKPPLCPF